jgi:hypothetical protein
MLESIRDGQTNQNLFATKYADLIPDPSNLVSCAMESILSDYRKPPIYFQGLRLIFMFE